jgi:regulator of sigma E protease
LPTIIISLIVFGLIVFVHEFGHYIIAKATGVRVEEFSLGMGPKIIGVTKGETVYSLRALPLGGFCKMTGENVLEEEENQKPDSKRFDTKPLWARFAIVVAGPVMNFLLAIVLFALIFTTIGIPVDNTIIGEVLPGHVAKIADIRPGDKITEINGVKVNGWSDVTTIIHNSSGKKLLINIERGTQRLEKIIVPKYDKENKMGLIGITPKNVWERKGIFEGIAMGYQDTYDVFRQCLITYFKLPLNMLLRKILQGRWGYLRLSVNRPGWDYLIWDTSLQLSRLTLAL